MSVIGWFEQPYGEWVNTTHIDRIDSQDPWLYV